MPAWKSCTDVHCFVCQIDPLLSHSFFLHSRCVDIAAPWLQASLWHSQLSSELVIYARRHPIITVKVDAEGHGVILTDLLIIQFWSCNFLWQTFPVTSWAGIKVSSRRQYSDSIVYLFPCKVIDNQNNLFEWFKNNSFLKYKCFMFSLLLCYRKLSISETFEDVILGFWEAKNIFWHFIGQKLS